MFLIKLRPLETHRLNLRNHVTCSTFSQANDRATALSSTYDHSYEILICFKQSVK